MVTWGHPWHTYGWAWGPSLDATNEKLAIRFTAQQTKTVNKIHLDLGLVGTSPTFRIGLQSDNAGDPSGTWLTGGTAYLDTTITNGENEIDIVNAALTADTVYHIVIE